MSPHGILLTTGPEVLQLHNQAQRLGDGLEFLTDIQQWGYSVSLRIDIPAPADSRLQPVLVVDVHVLDGMIGVGMLDDQMREYVSAEVDARPSPSPITIELPLERADPAAFLMVRNTAPHAVASRFRLLDAMLLFRPRDDRLLVPQAPPAIAVTIHEAPTAHATFDVLVSLSSRNWNAAQTDRKYLTERYASPGRLSDLPRFDSLPPNVAPYHGRLSVFRLDVSPAGVTGRILAHFESREKVQHACLVGKELVVCFDAGVTVFGWQMPSPHVEVIPECVERIADPWFGGLHTVVPEADGRTCLVSSSGADAILWLDVPARKVVRRWRLPESRYGSNYKLDETTWLSRHYIPNDLQLGHLNSAAPDGRGGVFCSVLGQGDIGRVSADGIFDLLATGYVGCHGVRYDATADLLYFSDSCGGRLMRVTGPNRVTVLFDSGSRWLHDSLHLGDGMFLLTLGDTNTLVLADTTRNRTLAEWDFGAAGGSVQFLSPGDSPVESRR